MFVRKITTFFLAMLLIFFGSLVLAGPQNDQNIMGDIKAKMASDQALASIPMQISVVEGVVTLSGLVDTPLEKQAFINMAESIPGVKRVDSYIIVRGTQGETPNATPGIQGAQGTQGVQGVQGIQGEQGAQGAQGTQGTQGATGAQGAPAGQGRGGSKQSTQKPETYERGY